VAEHCKTKSREKTVDRGKLIEYKTQEKEIARCPVCGRKEEGNWRDRKVEKEWKDGGRD
jgi:hypothetical protein